MPRARFKLRNEGMGGFLCPPTHPMHTRSVVEVNTRGREVGCMCLTSALEATYVPDNVRAQAKTLLDGWKAPSIDEAEVQDWIRLCWGYFKRMKRNHAVPEPRCWYASDMIVADRAARIDDPDLEDQAALHHIRCYYPDYQPTAEHLAEAYWGESKVA